MKRLLRRWLRKRIYCIYGLSYPDKTETAFEWVYESPVWEWRTRIFCLVRSDCYADAVKLLSFLNK